MKTAFCALRRALQGLLAIVLLALLAACGAPAAPSLAPAEAPRSEAPAAAPSPQQADSQSEEAAKPTEAPAANSAQAPATPIPLATSAAAPASEIAQDQATPSPIQTSVVAPAAPVPAPSATGAPQEAHVAGGAAEIGGEPAAKVADPILEPGVQATSAPKPTQEGASSSNRSFAAVTSGALEARIIEIEFPERMQLGDSDVVRIALVPDPSGYQVVTEIQGNTVVSSPVSIKRPAGYRVEALARLSAVNFEIDRAEQRSDIPAGERLDFRWTINAKQAGEQRISIELRLIWTPEAGSGAAREAQLYGRSLPVRVDAVLGLSAAQASQAGVAGLALGVGVSLIALVAGPRGKRVRQTLGFAEPNAALVLEPQASMRIAPDETRLLQTLFRRYARVVLEREFRSGYSGARTFLALPVRADGRADAYTIAKIGDKESIQQEYDNFERFVKDTLPPITARIQEAPVMVSGGDQAKAILRYTFIGEPGKLPQSLREALLVNPDPAPLYRLFDTFGPNWWMQRKPYAFRLAEEYDRVLPAHVLVERVEPTRHIAGVLDGALAPAPDAFAMGDVVMLRGFPGIEKRADGSGYSLTGSRVPGQPQLRVRYAMQPHGATPPEPMYGRIVGTRDTLLRASVQGLSLEGLPDPLLRIPSMLDTSVQGTQSTLHGDLNMENVLIGLGGIVWLIDFANTRDGHALYDFAHLEADLIAHVIAPQVSTPAQFVKLAQHNPQLDALRGALRAVALRCLFNPSYSREYDLAVTLACLGALKYRNLNMHQRQMLYLAAAQSAITASP